MNIIRFEQINDRIIALRNKQVLLDSDVAELYGVETRDINKAVKNNPEKFPEGYVIPLTIEEKNELVEIFHRFGRLKHSTVVPKAFTEKGLYMLATILKGPQAIQTTISIIEAFAKLRELSRNLQFINEATDGNDQKNLLQQTGRLFNDLLNDNLEIYDTETTVELNLALLKVKHTVKKKRPEPPIQS